MRLSLCTTSVALFWGCARVSVTFLHQNVFINKRYIISFAAACRGLWFFFALAHAIYSVTLRRKPSAVMDAMQMTGTKDAFVKCIFY